MATEGSRIAGTEPGTGRCTQVLAASVETLIATFGPQALLGRYTVPSGATRTWPWMPAQSATE